jgi:putative Holliday junction resolvase
MKYLGIDYGEKRVGIAISDKEGMMAFPKATLPNDRALMMTVKDFIKNEEAEAVVIGESKANSGEDNPIMNKVRQFVGDLERETGLPVHFEPEFYSSSEARMLKDQTGMPTQIIDAEAAAVILNSFLARTKEGDSPV